MYINTKTIAGFTLIELMITVFIISIIATSSFLGFSANRLRKDVELGAREAASAVREAQNYALTGSQGFPNTDPCRYQITWSGTAYSIVYWYKDGSGNCTQQRPIRSYTLKNGATFSNANNFYFSPPHANVSIAGGSMAMIVTKSGYTSAVCVYFNGQIREVEGSACP